MADARAWGSSRPPPPAWLPHPAPSLPRAPPPSLPLSLALSLFPSLSLPLYSLSPPLSQQKINIKVAKQTNTRRLQRRHSSRPPPPAWLPHPAPSLPGAPPPSLPLSLALSLFPSLSLTLAASLLTLAATLAAKDQHKGGQANEQGDGFNGGTWDPAEASVLWTVPSPRSGCPCRGPPGLVPARQMRVQAVRETRG